MTRAQKHQKRIARAIVRRTKKKARLTKVLDLMHWDNVPISSARYCERHGYYDKWSDSSSPTGYSQKCSWSGTCQWPCNGDC